MKTDAGGRAIIAVVAEVAGARDGGDSAGNDFTDALVIGIGDVNIIGAIERNAHGVIKFSVGGWPAISGIADAAVPRDGSDDTAS